jgi:hypothetical protein
MSTSTTTVVRTVVATTTMLAGTRQRASFTAAVKRLDSAMKRWRCDVFMDSIKTGLFRYVNLFFTL